jgi:hypothetical protein
MSSPDRADFNTSGKLSENLSYSIGSFYHEDQQRAT